MCLLSLFTHKRMTRETIHWGDGVAGSSGCLRVGVVGGLLAAGHNHNIYLRGGVKSSAKRGIGY